MPELPEVEIVKLGLQKLIINKTVVSVNFDWPKGFPNAQSDVNAFLLGATLTNVRRRAKVLLLDLSSNYTLVIHLKMTGQLVYVGKERFGAGHPNDSLIGSLPDKSTRIIFELNNNSSKDKKSNALEPDSRKLRSMEGDVGVPLRLNTAVADNETDQEQWQRFGLRSKPDGCDAFLFFNDQRKFGWVRLVPTPEVPSIDFMKRVGPEPLSADFTANIFIKRIRRRANTSIKAALLDQTVLAGIGNIYADESLFAAKIHPATKVKDVSDARFKKLLSEIKAVLQLSIEKGGSSDRNYVNAEGKKGSYISFAKVFRREGQPCFECGVTIEKSKVAGRGTHTCPSCQPH